uniref:DNA/RNA non-specific endonuclease/pyrophosphatase/phosphodiesterase domain-containing protein n=1 Tax=Cacopsylla melanoneura TaxID=428564 RepID=A0A8D8TKG7_9HEMI
MRRFQFSWSILVWCVAHINYVKGLEPVSHDKDCTIILSRKHLDDSAPLFLHYTPLTNSSTQLFLPETRLELSGRRINYLRVRNDESVLLACPGQGNLVQGFDKAVTVMACHDRKFSSQQSRIVVKELKCNDHMEVDVNKIGQCAQDDKFDYYKIGYKVLDKLNETLMEACFDPVTLTTLYTRHSLRGGTLKSAVQKKHDRPFKNVDKLYGSVNPAILYNKKSQRKMFASYLDKSLFKKYLSANSLTRTQLVPRKDFPMKSWRRAVDIYVNLAPQWKSIARGHWERMEINIRRVAMERNLTLDIITGILNDDKSGNNATQSPLAKPDFLDPTHRHIAIPDFFYKIVFDPVSKQGIVFVNDNNPLDFSGQKVCKDICSDNLWPSYKQTYAGVIYCCDVNEMESLLPGVPKVRVSGVLQGSNSLFQLGQDLLDALDEIVQE